MIWSSTNSDANSVSPTLNSSCPTEQCNNFNIKVHYKSSLNGDISPTLHITIQLHSELISHMSNFHHFSMNLTLMLFNFITRGNHYTVSYGKFLP